jgi:hypothetical protein
MLLEYTAVIWEHEDDILLQVIIPNSMDGNSGEAGTNVFRTGGGRSGGK